LKILLASLVMGFGIMGLKKLLNPMLQGSIPLQLLGVFMVIGIAALLYGITLHMLRLPELKVITEKIGQRFF